MWRKYILLFVIIGSTTWVHAQSLNDIKSKPHLYLYGEGSGTTEKEADANALAVLMSSISVSVIMDDTLAVADVNGISEEKFQSSIKTFSFGTLPNVQRRVLSEEPNASVIRFIKTSDIRQMYLDRETKIIDYINTAKKLEKQLQIDDAIRYYYWAYLLSSVHPQVILHNFDDEVLGCATYLPMKIKSMFSDLKSEVIESETEGNSIVTRVRFTYNGHDVSSLTFKYFNGESYVGPTKVKDGIGELDMLALPSEGKINTTYEYRFLSESENSSDAELRNLYSVIELPFIEATSEIAVKVNKRKQNIEHDTKAKEPERKIDAVDYVTPEQIVTKCLIELDVVEETTPYQESLLEVESAIKNQNPALAYNCFTPEGYKMFSDLLTNTGKVSLSGESNYSFLRTQSCILARSCGVKIKFANGASFIENLTFRFSPDSHKIESLAFALTKKAEDDIFNAAAKWSEISRYHILNFLEDYQTAYALKRADYLEQVFSDNAIIITGTVLSEKKNNNALTDGINISNVFNNEEVRYTRLNKREYLARLNKQFKEREYIHLTFEENLTRIVNTNGALPDGAAFAIQIHQKYSSPIYSDDGYLTLLLNMQGLYPIIEVRLWEPDQNRRENIDTFIGRFDF